MTNDEPVQFWVFTGTVLEQMGYTAPTAHLPYWLILFVAYFLHYLHLCLLQPISQALSLQGSLKQPFLTPFKVSLAATHHYYNCQKAKRDLGYRPLVSVKQGIDITIKHMKQQKQTQQQDGQEKKSQ